MNIQTAIHHILGVKDFICGQTWGDCADCPRAKECDALRLVLLYLETEKKYLGLT